MNKLYFGDNLVVLREHIPSESVDLIYLDPPFNSNKNYNILFNSPKGQKSEAQITAFEDTWHWGDQAEQEYTEILHQPNTNVAEMIQSFRKFLATSDMMAYLTMMTIRLLELHRVLKPTGSLYLHCDPTASHYLKVMMDMVFGADHFRNEITWKRQSAHNDARRKFASITDTILFYARSDKAKFNVVRKPLGESYINSAYRYVDQNGRRYRLDNLRSPNPRPNLTYEYKGFKPHPNGWAVSREKMEKLDFEGRLFFPKDQDGRIQLIRFLDENQGQVIPNLWDDILPLHGSDAELLGYPTQKPLALLERIINASSNPGDVVLDPFCGCGTAVEAAQKLDRQWIGIDITNLAISLIEKRLRDSFPGIQFEVIGTPKDLEGARDLALRDKYQFQWWACSLVNAQPYQGKKKGADSGIDGLIFFQDDLEGAKKIIVSVKGGESVSVSQIRDLKGTLDREKAAIGLFVTLAEPTRPMLTEAVSTGYYESPLDKSYPKVQILTIEGLLSGHQKAEYPDLARGGLTFKKSKPAGKTPGQMELGV